MWTNLLPTTNPFSGDTTSDTKSNTTTSGSNNPTIAKIPPTASNNTTGDGNGNTTTSTTTTEASTSSSNPFLAATSTFKDRLIVSLERTGEAVTQRATAHVKQLNTKSTATSTASTDSTSTGGGESSELEATAKAAATKLKDSFTSAFEFTSDAVAKNFESSQNNKNNNNNNSESQSAASREQSTSTTTNTTNTPSTRSPTFNQARGSEMFTSLKSGWGSMVTATIQAVETTKEIVEKEQTRMTASLFKKGSYRRDVTHPLDTEALCDAEVVYITDRLITMGHPAMQSPTDGDITG
eukprot:CAMPEP_0198261682 /NCGR_PEP_ID=MMETSP1447-20131203/10365_1 /TAXON_ID=420782 /ORGANISM="Chaetoceros dichaeta, Strain CCMP1751" /LENGTH=295 /DNA_ID=CAMNT_0043949677 /DNA_START=21 /DNA_END=904 /DNA_ORIENTATION=+